MDTRLQKNPLWLSLLLASHFRYRITDFAEQHNLTVSQLQALLLLEPDTPIPMNRLSCLVGCDPSFATGIVDKLVGTNLIERHESTEDRRVKTIILSSEGAMLRDTLIADFLAYYQGLAVAGLSTQSFTKELATYTESIVESDKTKAS